MSITKNTRQCVAAILPDGWVILPEPVDGPRIRLRSPSGFVRYVAHSGRQVSQRTSVERGDFSTPERRAEMILRVAGVRK